MYFDTDMPLNTGTITTTIPGEREDVHLEVFHVQEGVLKAARNLYGPCFVEYEFKWGSSWLDKRPYAKQCDRLSPLRTIARLVIKNPKEDISLWGITLCSESDNPSIATGMKIALGRLKETIEEVYLKQRTDRLLAENEVIGHTTAIQQDDAEKEADWAERSNEP